MSANKVSNKITKYSLSLAPIAAVWNLSTKPGGREHFSEAYHVLDASFAIYIKIFHSLYAAAEFLKIRYSRIYSNWQIEKYFENCICLLKDIFPLYFHLFYILLVCLMIYDLSLFTGVY